MSFGTRHNPPPRLSLPGSAPGLLLAIAGFCLFLPNTDAFAAQFQSFPGPFELLGGWLAFQISNRGLYRPIVALGLVLVLVLCRWRFPKSLPFYLTCLISTLTLTWACFLALIKDTGFVTIRSDAFVDIVIVTLAFLIGCLLASRPQWLPFLFVGIGFAVLIKLAYSVAVYGQVGGIEIVNGVETIQGDGGTLETQGFMAAVTTIVGLDALFRKRWKVALCMVLVSLIFAAGLAASFRRLTLLKMAGVSLGGILLLSCLRNQVRRGILLSIAACGMIALVTSAVTVSVFGLEQATDRLASLTLSGGSANNLASSNKVYTDDWAAFPQILERSAGIGVGLRQSYGIHRLVDDDFSSFIPLHIASFELWASLGVPGALYHLTLFVFIPLVLIRRAYLQRSSLIDAPFFSVFAALLLWNGLVPLGSPFCFSPQPCLLLGLGLGWSVSISASARHCLVARAQEIQALGVRVIGPRVAWTRSARRTQGHSFYRPRQPAIQRWPHIRNLSRRGTHRLDRSFGLHSAR